MKKHLIYFAAITFLFFSACGSGEQKADEEMVDLEEVQESENTDEVISDEEVYGAGQEITEDMRVFFGNLKDGDQVASPFVIEMGVEGMEVEPAGKMVLSRGHHHVLINRGFYETGTVVPMDENNKHFGDGSTQTTLELEPGEYTLTLQFADGLHQSYGEAMSASIKISVQ
jgi:Domain of unknown function (DUF4399)